VIKINYPPYEPKIRGQETVSYIFDDNRKKWVKLSPEEWVRQHFLQYIMRVVNYPASLIAVEKTIQVGELKKRFDIVVHDNNGLPWMLIECKEMNAALNRNVLDQALRYNIKLQVPYIVITNGTHCMAFANEKGRLRELNAFPTF
jgi:hypothetical protein